MSDKVLVKDSDVISAKGLLHLLSDSIEGMKHQVKTDEKLSEKNKYAIAGAIEALTDLHNLILERVKNQSETDSFADDSDHGGRFDA